MGRLDDVLPPPPFRRRLEREPRFYADYRRVHFRAESLLAEGNGNDINAALVALGGEFGLWGLRQARGCEGLRISLFGAVFAQFNLDARSASVPELTIAQIKDRAERLARSMLNTSREEAFKRLDKGELDGTMVGVELAMMRSILERG